MQCTGEWPGLAGGLLVSPCSALPQTQQAKWVGYQGTLDYHGADFTASLTLANPDPIAGSAVAVAQYLQALTPRWALYSSTLP